MLISSKTPLNQLETCWDGAFHTRCINIVAEMGIADLIGDGVAGIEDLAAQTHTDPAALYQVLRFLAGHGLFEEEGYGRFKNTVISNLLLSDSPDSMRDFCRTWGGRWHWKLLENLELNLKTGKHSLEAVYAVSSLFEYFQKKSPAEGVLYGKGMNNLAGGSNEKSIDGYNFKNVRTVCDVGGSFGNLLHALLPRYPSMNGILFDMPNIIQEAPKYEPATLQGRIQYVSGDFFKEVPIEADLYVLKHILHCFDKKACGTILQNIRKVAPFNSKLLIMELIVSTNSAPDFIKALDVHMMMTYSGRERTYHEFYDLLEENGFMANRLIPIMALEHSPMPLQIIEATPL